MGRAAQTLAAATTASPPRTRRCNCRIGHPLGYNHGQLKHNTSECDLHGARIRAGKICYACGFELSRPIIHGLCETCQERRSRDETAMEAGSWRGTSWRRVSPTGVI